MRDMTNGSAKEELDVLVVGAGVAGLYLVHRLHRMGFRVTCLDEASGVGGTWHWNRYPGARCDVESMFYSYEFDADLQQEWQWTERYAAQPEILRYLNHVADRFDLRRHILFDTRVRSAHFDDQGGAWRIETEAGRTFTARHCVMATGCLSATNVPAINGLDRFANRIFLTARWPHEAVNFTNRRVAVIGTGSTAVQAIPEIARKAEHLFVFQRTPNYVVPAQNRPLDADEVRTIKADYEGLRAFAKTTPGGFNFSPNDTSALAASEEERNREFENRWQEGGIPFLGAFNDLVLDEEANRTAQNFVRAKIRAIVNDPEIAEKLCPNNIIGCKRLCLDTGYFETFNRANVTLVDVAATPIELVTPVGIQVAGTEYAVDDLVLATGFDAMTGALQQIDIRGRGGVRLTEKWATGPRTYLGLAMSGFPNLFIVTGPGSPSVLSNMMPTIEQHVEWICDCIGYLRHQDAHKIEAVLRAEDAWVDHVNDVARKSLRHKCDSWYLGTNIPGKPRVFMPYIGGMPAYRQKCEEVAAAGYEGFVID